jgi:hypothetical protein
MQFVRFDDISFETWTSWMICHKNSWKNQILFQIEKLWGSKCVEIILDKVASFFICDIQFNVFHVW